MSLKFSANDLRLKPGEEPTAKRLAELLNGIQENFEQIGDLFPLGVANIGSGTPRAAENLRIIRGTIKTDGTVKVGAGFSLSAVGTGEVKVLFEAGMFSATPTVVPGAGATSASVGAKILGGSTPSKSEVTLVLFNTTTGAATAGLIEFVAAGPR